MDELDYAYFRGQLLLPAPSDFSLEDEILEIPFRHEELTHGVAEAGSSWDFSK